MMCKIAVLPFSAMDQMWPRRALRTLPPPPLRRLFGGFCGYFMRGWNYHRNHLLIISRPRKIATAKSINGISKVRVPLIWLLNMTFHFNEFMSSSESENEISGEPAVTILRKPQPHLA